MARTTFWAGVIDGEIDIREVDTGWGGYGSGDGMVRAPMLFTSRAVARREYQKVVKVEIRIIK